MHGNAKKWREKMGEIIFGVIGIGIISAAILNIVSTQRMWTKKIAFLLGLYSYFAYSMWGNFIFIIIESGCIFVLIKYYMTHSKISGKITKIKYKEINSEVWCCFFIDKYPNATFWLLQEVIERERLRKEDEVVFWAKKITDEFFKIDSFSRVKAEHFQVKCSASFLLFSFMVAVTERNKTHKNILCRKNRILFYISYKKENGFGICIIKRKRGKASA